MKFLLDTNFLMIPWMFKVDIYSLLKDFEHPEFYTLDLVIQELEKLSKRRGKHARYAKMALHDIKKEGVSVIPYGKKGPVDKAIIDIAGRGFVVCTQDKDLIKKIKKQKFSVISMRQKKYLQKV